LLGLRRFAITLPARRRVLAPVTQEASMSALRMLCLVVVFAVAGAASAAAPPVDDVVYINDRHFTIPVVASPETRELLLYLSRDQGRTWKIHTRVNSSSRGIDFSAPTDGLYYFIIVARDQADRMHPDDPYTARTGQKICIDTVKPVVKITSAKRIEGEVFVAWEVKEEHPEWSSLKLEYRLSGWPNGKWTPLPIIPGERGKLHFRPEGVGAVTLRLSMKDQAGNEGDAEGRVSGAKKDALLDTRLGATAGALVGTVNRSPVRGALSLPQIINKKKAKIYFEVPPAGPSGLGSVDVYVTTDEGATWEKSAADPNVTLPVTGEARGLGPVKGSVTVNLPKDAVIYGFYLVVKSRAGLGKPPPRAGDPPQVRIEVDTTLPTAELYAPQPDLAHPHRLMLTWKAEDRNLAALPISLEWAATASGPWTFIGDPQLPNTGRYSWQVPENIPAKVFLRLSVRDSAGNNAVAMTDQPVLIDLKVPDVPVIKKVEGLP
jgi:hypothetical protein